MITLEGFIKEEVNGHIRNLILTRIEQGKSKGKSKDELVFNRYSLEFLFEENKVIIYDDVFSEDGPLKLSLDKFLKSISNI